MLSMESTVTLKTVLEIIVFLASVGGSAIGAVWYLRGWLADLKQCFESQITNLRNDISSVKEQAEANRKSVERNLEYIHNHLVNGLEGTHNPMGDCPYCNHYEEE